MRTHPNLVSSAVGVLPGPHHRPFSNTSEYISAPKSRSIFLLSQFSIYSRKGEERVGGLGTHVVKKLTEDLKKKNHVFFSITSHKFFVIKLSSSINVYSLCSI